MSSKIELLGVDQLLADIRKKFGDASNRLEKKALYRAAQPIKREIEARINRSKRKHIHMKDDIKLSKLYHEDGIAFITIGPGKETAWRAHFVEFGTGKLHPARPFMDPGFRAGLPEAKQIMIDELRKGLEEG